MLYKQILAQAGLPAEIVELLVGTDLAIARGDLNSSSRDLHTLIGRDTLRDLLADTPKPQAVGCNPSLAAYRLTEVQGMPLIVFDNELLRSPSGHMHVLYQMNSISLQRVCRGRGIVRFQIEVEVFPLIHELDRGILFVYKF
jgi:hypothetical protein